MRINGDSQASNNAAAWIKQKYNIGGWTPFFDKFEREFKCEVTVGDRNDGWYVPDWIDFEDERDGIMFILRWS